MNPYPAPCGSGHRLAQISRLWLAPLAFFALALHAEAARGRPYINAANTTFVADNGRLIRGAIYSSETGNVPSLASVQAIKNQGLNAIHLYAERADYGYSAGAKRAAVDQIVQMTRDNGLYLIITIGGGGVNASFVQNFWNFYAPLYKNETHVLYEIQNEPVVNAPVASSVITMEKNAYDAIRIHAPDTPVLLMSYTIFQNSAGVLADMAALGPGIDWSKAAIAFHGYGAGGPGGTRNCLVAVLNAGYPCFQTEFYRWPWGTGNFDLVDDPSLHQDVDETGDLERLGVSWLTFLSLAKVTDEVRFKNRLNNAGISWTPDFGAWPTGARGVHGNGGEPRSVLRSAALRIQAEDFDTGGQGKAYHDITAGNSGGQYRTADNVDIQTTTDTGGGYNVGWFSTNEWLEYTVNVKHAGTYSLNVRVASTAASNNLNIKLGGVDLTGAWTFAGTGGNQTWTTISKTVNLTPGQQVLRFTSLTGVFNVNWIELSPATSGVLANGTYKIINRNSGKALDVVDASTANGAKVQQWGYSATANQQWVLTHRGANQYTLTSVQTGKAIDVSAASILSGDYIQMYSLNPGSQNQNWLLTSTGSGYYKIVSANSGLALDIDGASTANGARAYQYEYSGGAHQQWQLAAP